MNSDKILALSDDCINKIAAGEVIERPASIVKEMVENSLDAGSSEISILIKEGGKNSIRISDNGRGIRFDDLKICFARHATSKIRSAEELFAVATSGFRGEALASIASIAQVSLESRFHEEEQGWKLEVEDGQIGSPVEFAKNQGCTFEVKDIFYNTPVRRKFLSSVQAETTRIVDIVTRISLAYPEVRFTLHHGTKELYSSPAGTQNGRIADVLGTQFSRKLLPMEYEDGFCEIHGVITPPEQCKGRRTQQYFYLNKRPIWNPSLSKALQRGFESLAPGKFPAGVVFIKLPEGEFDVNVHPAKREVRFTREDLVFSGIVRAVKDALTESFEHPHLKVEVNKDYREEDTPPNALSLSFQKFVSESQETTEAVDSSNKKDSKSEPASLQRAEQRPVQTPSAPPEEPEEQDLFATSENIISLRPDNYKEAAEKREKAAPIPAVEVRYYQLANRYIVCEDSKAMILIDQKAAHQRILYQEAMDRLQGETQGINSQQLLFPEVLEFTPEEAQILAEHLEYLGSLAFDLAEFGPNCYQLRGIPLELPSSRGEEAVREIMHELISTTAASTPQDRIAKAYARGTAIMTGEALDNEKMSAMVDTLFSCEDPFVSPFGQAVIIRFPLEEIQKKFTIRPKTNNTF